MKLPGIANDCLYKRAEQKSKTTYPMCSDLYFLSVLARLLISSKFCGNLIDDLLLFIY